jgi:hypothetical protein
LRPKRLLFPPGQFEICAKRLNSQKATPFGFRRLEISHSRVPEQVSHRADIMKTAAAIKKHRAQQEERIGPAMAAATAADRSDSIRAIARDHQVPRSTIRNRLKRQGKPQSPYKSPHTRGPPTFLSVAEELQVVSKLTARQEAGYPTGPNNNTATREIARQVAIESGKVCEKAPSDRWVQGFLRRHGDAFRRGKTQQLDTGRINLTQAALTNWTDKYVAALDESFGRHWSKPAWHARIWNMDETGFAEVDTSKQSTLVVRTASNQTANTKVPTLGSHITVAITVSASGESMAPFVIASAARVNPLWQRQCPPGTTWAATAKGSMEQAIFTDYIQHFIDNVPARYDLTQPTLLLVDNHSSRCSPTALARASAHKIHIFGLLANSTHFLQPCDRHINANYKRAFGAACALYAQAHSGNHVPKTALGAVLTAAQAALTEETIVKSWADTGLIPLNRALLDHHPSILVPLLPIAPAPAAAAASAPSSAFGLNGQFRGSGVFYTSQASIDAIRERQEDKSKRATTVAARKEQSAAKRQKLDAAGTSTHNTRPKRDRQPLASIDTNRGDSDEEYEHKASQPVAAAAAAFSRPSGAPSRNLLPSLQAEVAVPARAIPAWIGSNSFSLQGQSTSWHLMRTCRSVRRDTNQPLTIAPAFLLDRRAAIGGGPQ